MLLLDYSRILDALGCSGAVVVQPSFYGADNRAMLAAMKTEGPAFRGVVVIGDNVTASELESPHARGVRGARLNIMDVREGKGQLLVDRIMHLAGRIKPFGGHIESLMHVTSFRSSTSC